MVNRMYFNFDRTNCNCCIHKVCLIFIQKRITSLLRGTYFQMAETKQKTFKMSRKQDI